MTNIVVQVTLCNKNYVIKICYMKDFIYERRTRQGTYQDKNKHMEK